MVEHAPQSPQITTGKVAKYMLLPGILPRLRRMAGLVVHFLHIFTMTFGAAGLIPHNHPCLLTQNIGQYRFRDIIGLAASNVEFSKKNIPQILMFFSVIGAFLMTILMVGLVIVQLASGVTNAHAQYFSNPAAAPPVNDVAYNFLHNTFGQVGLADIWTGTDNPAGNLMADMVAGMLATYSQAMLIIAGFIVIYLLITTVAESAQTGQPFGKRFDTVWAPIRLAVAVGLLVPITSGGYNSAQLIVFQAAHWGSALATNIWVNGLTRLNAENFISASRPDPGYVFARGAFLILTCEEAWNETARLGNLGADEYVNFRTTPEINSKSVLYEWGVGLDYDFCGSIRVPAGSADVTAPFVEFSGLTPPDPLNLSAFSQAVERHIATYLADLLKTYQPMAKRLAESVIDTKEQDIEETLAAYRGSVVTPIRAFHENLGRPSAADDRFYVGNDWDAIFDKVDASLIYMISSSAQGGWASAGASFLAITKANNYISAAASMKPEIVSLPALLENPEANPYTLTLDRTLEIAKDNLAIPFIGPMKGLWEIITNEQNSNAVIGAKINIILNQADGWFFDAPRASAADAAYVDYAGLWEQELMTASRKANRQDTSNSEFVRKMMRYVSRVFDSFALDDINPIGRLIFFGNTLLASAGALTALGILASSSIAGFSAPALGSVLLAMASVFALSGFALAIGITALPFIYFLFAVVEWIASVFEAAIGMPLWALSFLTIGGDGFFGERAAQGAWLIFEIFLRPTVIIMVFVGITTIFYGAIGYLNAIYAQFVPTIGFGDIDTGRVILVLASGSLFSVAIQMLAYIVLYVFLTYSLAVSLYKLIDEIPNQFMRWLGVSANGLSGITTAGVQGASPYLMTREYEKVSGAVTGALAKGLSRKPKDPKTP